MELGLLYYNARFYAPTLDRFISADTLIPNPANPQSYNRYAYVGNRPLNFSDPTGHCKGANLASQCLVDGDGGFLPSVTAIALAGGMSATAIQYFAQNPEAMWAVHETLVQARESVDDVLAQAEEVVNSTPELGNRDYFVAPLDWPTDKNDDGERVIYQFAERDGSFKNGPDVGDFDGISVAVADLCGTPSHCLSAMFNGREPTANDYFRQTTVGNLQDQGFVVTLNGGQPMYGMDDMYYPLAHASVTHPGQRYRDNGSPQWTGGIKNSFRSTFGPGLPVMN
jgi:RHS repeat-associated protein